MMRREMLEMIHQQAAEERNARLQLSIGQATKRLVIPLATHRKGGAARLEIARVLFEAIGFDLLADDVEILLNGTSLAGELIDVACQPEFSYAI